MDVKKRAKKYKRQILKYYDEVKVKMDLDFVRAIGNLFIFRIVFVPGTTEDKIRHFLEAVQQTLDLELCQLHLEGKRPFLVVSECNTFDNRLLGILTSPSYAEHIKDMQIPYPIGFNVLRKPIIVDLTTYYNWLLGGAGGSGKTTNMQGLAACILWSCSPEQVNLIIIDEPVNFNQFTDLPHLSCPVIHDIDAGYKAVMNIYKEMKRRQKLKEDNPEEFKLQPVIVCFIDECVSFVVGAGRQKSLTLADIISLLLRMGRHAGIYLVLATQNPAIEEMKCDLRPITSRISFTCAKPIDSVTILGEGGAEKLSGNGEMYFKSQHSELMYLKGALVTPDEIDAVCNHVRAKYEEAEWNDQYKFTIDAASLQPDEEGTNYVPGINSMTATLDNDDKIFAKIIMWALGRETVSGNAIHQAFKAFSIGQRKAGELLERLHKFGIVDEAQVIRGSRKVLPTTFESLRVETVSFLNRYGYTNEDICNALSDTSNQSEVVDDGEQDIQDDTKTDCHHHMSAIAASVKQVSVIIDTTAGIITQTNQLALDVSAGAVNTGECSKDVVVAAGEIGTLVAKSADEIKKAESVLQNLIEKTEYALKMCD